ncbi:PAS domain S-box protein [Desulfoferula mesophila]|uniref:histidine kinase n=1 Tax=Desulfoferula mesophila TaxID=3058419 RepID=A0AAU9EYP5_9BACT|nr:hypothetical protein FAK_09580 [Desulfoferula mesophilus]
MKKIRKPAYEELEQLLAEYEQILDVIRRGEVDAIVTQGQPILLRPHELQKKLSESQAALMEAQTIAKVGNWHYDLAADQSVWSEEMFHIHGLDPEQGVPTWEEYREFIHPEDLPRLSQTFSTMLGGMPSRRGEYRIVRRDGSTAWVEGIVRSVKSQKGDVLHLVGTLQDLTERKLAEQALAQSEEKYRSLFRSIRDAIIISDNNRKIVDCNPAFTAIFGYTLEEIIGKEVSLVYRDRDEFRRMNHEIKRHYGESYFLQQFNMLRKNGDAFPAEISMHFLRSDDNAIAGTIGILRDVSERQKAERALAESEKNFRTVFENAPEGMSLLNREQQFIEVNQRLCDILGYSEQELLGKTFNEFTHPDDRQPSHERWDKLISNKATRTGAEKRYIKKNGETLWVQISNTVLYDEQGNIKFIIGHLHDINERIIYQRELIRERDLSQKYLDTAGVILLALGKDGRIEMINRQGCLLLGCEMNEIIGWDWFANFIPEDDRPRVRAAFDDIMAGMLNLHAYEEGRVTSLYGEQRHIRWFNTTIKDAEGNITGTLSSGEDITEKIQDRETINRLAAIVESSQDAIFGKDLNGVITSWNAAAERIYGYTAAEVIGQSTSLLIPEDRMGEVEYILATIKQGKAARIQETVRKCKDGSLIDMSLSVSPVEDGQGNIVGSATIAHPITEIKKAQQERQRLETQLRQAQKMEAIGTLAGGIAHDFNNILAVIMGYSGLVLDDLPPDSPAAESINTVIDAATRAKELTYQILSFSRQTEHQKVAMDLVPLIKESLKMLRATLPATIKLEQRLIPGDSGQVLADPVQIQQILMNLCTNAAQAMEDSNGILGVGLEMLDLDDVAVSGYVGLKPGNYLRLSITDTGMGIDEKDLERIFDPFFTTKDVGKGTGMGLPVVHGIVRDHGGFIAVESEPGRGTTFNVYLPVVAQGAPSEEPAVTQETPGGSESIAFVDDEPDLVDIGKRALSRLGYEVTCFTSSREALQAICANPDKYDLLVTDYTMPEMTGVQLAREVLEARPDIPIIICTGYPERLDTAADRGFKISELIMKPLVPSEISRVVRAVLDESKREVADRK